MILHHNCAEKFILLKFEAQRIIRPITSLGKVSLSSLIHQIQRTGAKASSAGREYDQIPTSVRRVAVAAHQRHFAGRWACGDQRLGAGGRCRGSGMGVVMCCVVSKRAICLRAKRSPNPVVTGAGVMESIILPPELASSPIEKGALFQSFK